MKGAGGRRDARRLGALPLVGLLLAGPAEAHYPHDMAFWVAVSPDPSTPRLATSLEQIDLDLLGRSEDGHAWAARFLQTRDDGGVPSGAFLTDARLVVATTRQGLLVSEDAGDTFSAAVGVTDHAMVRVVPSPDVLVDGLAFAAGESAVWRTVDGGLTWEAVWTSMAGGFVDVDVSPAFATDGRVCAAEAEALACSEDRGETWTRTAVPPNTSRLSVGADHRVWATVRGDGLYASPDDGATWSLAGFAGADLSVVAELSGGLVLLAEGDTAEWRSTDGGVTWDEVEVMHIVPDQSRDGINFFDFVEGPEGAVYFTTWNGLARSDDRGLTYRLYETEPIQNTHSVMLTKGDDGAVSAWLGTYGGGPLLVDLTTLATQTFPSLPKRFTRSTPATPDWERDGTAIFDEGYCTWRTTDHGATWDRIAQDPATADNIDMGTDVKGVALSPDPSADPFLLTTQGEGVMTFRVSEDLGDTWVTGVADPACDTDAFTVGLSPRWPTESRAWAACGGLVYESTDRGRTWAILADTGARFIARFAERSDGALLVGTSAGLYRVDEAGVALLGFGDTLVEGVAASEDGDTVFALVPREGWFRSDDGGDTWTELAAPTADVPRMVSLSPSYATDGMVAVAGYGGAWASADRGETWSSIYTEEVYETYHDAWRTTGDWVETDWDDASSAEIEVTEQAGAAKEIDFQGVGVQLEGPAGGGCGGAGHGVVSVSLDGADPEEVDLPAADGVVWASGDLEDGWHTLRVQAVSGTVALDDVRITRIPHPGVATCGCAVPVPRTSLAPWVGLATLTLLRRRRPA